MNSAYLLVSIVGLWAGSVYVPASVTYLASKGEFDAREGTRAGSLATVILSIGTILGCIVLPPIAERLGRRPTLAWFFLLMSHSISIGFGYVSYLKSDALPWFLVIPRDGVRICDVGGTVCRRGHHLPGGGGCRLFSDHRDSCCAHLDRISGGLLLIPLGVETRGKQLPD